MPARDSTSRKPRKPAKPAAASAGPYYFDKERARAAVEFFPRFLHFVDGEWAGKPFELQPWQARHVGEIFGWRRRDDGTRRYRFVRLWVPRKNGKGLALDTPLPTPSGWTTMGEITVGDLLYDERGQECRVTFASDLHHIDCYEIVFSNGEIIRCDGDHHWLTTARIDRPGSKTNLPLNRGMTRVRKAREIFKTQISGPRGDRNHSLKMPFPIMGREAVLPISPYVLGAWLGDGTSLNASITSGQQDVDELSRNLSRDGVHLKRQLERSVWRLSIGHADLLGDRDRTNSIQVRLRELGILGKKRIPKIYLRANWQQRLALLQGLMDTDGCISKNGNIIELVTTSSDLADDYSELLASLGIKFSHRKVSMRCNGRPVEGIANRFQFCVGRDQLAVFRLERKLSRQKNEIQRARSVQIVSVRQIESIPTRCIQVDSPSHQYLCGRSMLPTHNTELAAGLAHLLTVADGEPGAQVFSHALQGDQAGLCFDKAARMVAISRDLSTLYEVTAKGLFCPALMSSFRWLSGEAFGKHGLSPHANIGDEAHAWRNGNLHNFLIQGMGARRQPLDLTISTAGQIKTYGHELYEQSKAIMLDPSLDEQTYAYTYEADPKCDWTDPKIWKQANPNLGVSLKHEFLEAECRRAVGNPRMENDFKRYHLNIWVEQATRWLAMARWPENTAEPGNPNFWRSFEPLRPQATVYGGLDLAAGDDITALVWVIPPENPEGRVRLVCRFWVPEERIDYRDTPRTPYRRWVEQGALRVTPGNVTDYDFIEAQIMQDAAAMGCNGLGYDPWRARQSIVHLMNEGLPLVEFRQGHESMGDATAQLDRLFASGRLEHGNHPVLEWMFSNATVRYDANNNYVPDKKRAADKIDGVVAAVMGIGLMTAAQMPQESVYDILAREDAKRAPERDQDAEDMEILRNPMDPRWQAAMNRHNLLLARRDED